MYAYVYDSFLQDRKFATEIVRIESRLSQLGLQGRSEKITVLKSLTDAAANLIKRGATTIVAVGNDQTVTKLLPVVIDQGVTLAMIPVGQPLEIASFLGVPSGPEACEVLSRRVVRKLDVGRAGQQYFLLQAKLTSPARITCDHQYTVEAMNPDNQLTIGNLGAADPFGQPTDGRLELIVDAPPTGWQIWRRRYSTASVFPIKHARVQPGQSASLILDGQTMIKTPAVIDVAAKKLSVIVGRDRRVNV